MKISIMSLHEFDALVHRMQTSFDYALNLGQKIEAAKILFQRNEQLPDDLQVNLDEIETPDQVSDFISQFNPQIKSAIVEYRQRLME